MVYIIGHRRFPIQEVQRILKGEYASSDDNVSEKEIINQKKIAIYARVSSHKQKKRGDLLR